MIVPASNFNGSGCQWWEHDGTAGVPTYPSGGQGAATTTHSSSSLFGARVVVIYKVIVRSGAALDTLALKTVTSGGVATNIAGFSALDVSTTGTEYDFPGGLRVESTHANISATTADASLLSIFYRKIA